MLVVALNGTGAIGAASADLFSNGPGGRDADSGRFQRPRSRLWLTSVSGAQASQWLLRIRRSHRHGHPGRHGFHAATLTDDVERKAITGEGMLPLAGKTSDVDWEDGQTLTARIVRDWTSCGRQALNSSGHRSCRPFIGTAQAGETLTADVINGVNDEDGLTSVSYSYQWVANDADHRHGHPGRHGFHLHPDR